LLALLSVTSRLPNRRKKKEREEEEEEGEGIDK
jgi:hypothetical protein